MRLAKISLILIIIVLSHIHVQADEYDKYVFQIKAAKSSSDTEAIFQTGFVTTSYNGIITALHGVVGRNSITATDESQKQSFSNLKITHADIANDLAVISSSRLKNKLEYKLAVSQNYNLAPLEVHGYPFGIKAQLGSKQVNLRKSQTVQLYELFPADMTEKERAIFKTRKSPSRYARVLALEAQLEKGHSGAPLVNGARQVVGVCIGGIKGTEFSFAIPWGRTDFKKKKEIEKSLNLLAGQDPGQLLMALDLAEKDEPKFPELKMRLSKSTGNFRIENKGAPMFNAEAEFIGLVSIMGFKCEMENFVSVTSEYFYHDVSHGRDSNNFFSFFSGDYKSAVSWFKEIKQKVGQINKYCLNSVELEHLIKVKYDDESGGKHRRYFAASKLYQHYIQKNTRRRIIKEGNINLRKVTPGDWRDGLRMVNKASEIKFWRVSKSNIAHAHRYLSGTQAAFSPNVPATPKRLKVTNN